MTALRLLIAILLLISFSSPVQAERTLNWKEAERQEIRTSMLGFRDTLIFYVFQNQQAVLVLSIGNKDTKFPVTGNLHLFDRKTTKEAIAKWINNQHSDGLFADAPQPIFSKQLPKGHGKVISHRKTGTIENSGPQAGNFTNFEVKFSIKAHAIEKEAKWSVFTDTALVHVRAK